MNSEQIKDMHLLYSAVYDEDLREQFDEYNNTIYDDNIVEFATEYFYSHGLNDDGIDILIEELGVGEFAEFVYDIVEECTLTEARRSGRIEPVTKAGKPIGSLKGGAKASAIAAKRRQKQSERNGSDDRPSGMTAALRSQATKAASKKQPETKSTPDKTKKGIASKIGSALKRAGEDIAITYKVAREVGKRAEKSAPVRKFWGFKDKEEVKEWVNQLVEEGYDLSEYTWDEMAEIYEDKYRPKTKAQLKRYVSALGKLHNIATGKPESNEEPNEKPNEKPKRKTQLRNVQIKEEVAEDLNEASPSNPNLYKGKHGQTSTQYMAGRSDAGKIISGDDKSGPLGYSNRYINDEPTQPGQRTTTQRTSKSMKDADLEYGRLRYNQSVKDGSKFGGPKGLPKPKGGGTTARTKFDVKPLKIASKGGGSKGGGSSGQGLGSSSGTRTTGYQVGGAQGYGISGIKIADSYDLYDIILSHLLDEGYAETQEQAEVIMVNMSEDWRHSICESAVPGKPAERLGAITSIPEDEREAARQRTLAKAKEKREKMGKGKDRG